MVAANSIAIKIARVTKDTPEPEYGKIFRDDSGESTGVFHTILPSENPFTNILLVATTELKEEAIKTACYDYNKEEMTAVIDATVGKVSQMILSPIRMLE
jgi:predicted amidohydrolase YtcJ